MKKLLYVVSGIAIAILLNLGWAKTALASPYWIFVDVSGSSPIWREAFSAKVGHYVSNEIARMEAGSSVSIRSLGQYQNDQAQLLTADLTLNRRNMPRDVGNLIGNTLRDIPTSKLITPQDSSHLVGGLDQYAAHIGCSRTRANIVLISDGVETAVIDKTSKRELRFDAVGRGQFSGCRLTVIGIGVGVGGQGSEAATAAIRNAWNTWGKAAGFSEVVLLSSL